MGFMVKNSFQWLPIFFLTISVCVSALNLQRVEIARRTEESHSETIFSAKLPEELKTFYHPQRIDHFNYRPDSFATFEQRYMINFKYWGGARSNAPIFALLGSALPIEYEIIYMGFLRDNAPKFNALIVYIEHRYYGKSVPFGSIKEATRNVSTIGYLNSAQALADFAEVLLHIKKNFSAYRSPIIVIGGGVYGGLLASWFRLKYPHVALGALASSAPILYFGGTTSIDRFYHIVTKNFQETSESCYETIRKSWLEMDRIAKTPGGLSSLSKRFKTCKKLNKISELKNYLELQYHYAAFNFSAVHRVCEGINSVAKKTDILGQIFEGVVAYNRSSKSCNDMNEYDDGPYEVEWQLCTELVVRLNFDNWNESMFQPKPFNMKKYANKCRKLFGILPQSHWVTIYYGGQDLEQVLHRFASNIIFYNGLKDPWSSGGVLKNITNSVIAVTTLNGTNSLDLFPAKPSDPQWLVTQRNTEVKIIKGWIAEYQDDLNSTNTS